MPTAGRFDHDRPTPVRAWETCNESAQLFGCSGFEKRSCEARSRAITPRFSSAWARVARRFGGRWRPFERTGALFGAGPCFYARRSKKLCGLQASERAARGRPGPVEGWSYVARDGHATSERLGLFFNCRGEASIQRPRSAARCRVPSDPAAGRHPTAARFIGARAHVHRRQQLSTCGRPFSTRRERAACPRGRTRSTRAGPAMALVSRGSEL